MYTTSFLIIGMHIMIFLLHWLPFHTITKVIYVPVLEDEENFTATMKDMPEWLSVGE